MKLVHHSAFDGHDLAVVEMNGVQAWLAKSVGTALGYTDPGRLTDLIRADWSDQFVDGVDHVLVTGPELAALKSAGLVGKNAPSALLLTESGVNLAAIMSKRPESTRLRQWLAREVMPQIRKQGSYGVADVRRAKSEAMLEVVQHLPAGVAVEKLREALDAVPDRAAEIARYALDLVGKAPKAQPAEPAPVKRMSAVHAARSVLATALSERHRLATGPRGPKGVDWIGRFDCDGDGWSWVALRTDFVDRHLTAMGLAPMKMRTRWRDDGLTSPRAGKPLAVTTPTTLPGGVVPEETIRFDRVTVNRLLDGQDVVTGTNAFVRAAMDAERGDVEDMAEGLEHRLTGRDGTAA